MLSVILIGAGNVASHLYRIFTKSENIRVNQWYNRNLDSISSFKNDVPITDRISELQTADVYIMAVKDDVVSEMSSKFPFEERLVVHTSGSVGIHDLDKKLHRGVFYPLQTFSKDAELDVTQIPICIETIRKEDRKTLKQLGQAMGCETYRVNSEQRKALHLAAVYVNNFTNQLYRIAHEITESQGVDFNILKPLINETAHKIQELSPYRAQTGPAKRNDQKTIKKHLKLLEKEHHKAIYKLLTESIQSTHGRKKL